MVEELPTLQLLGVKFQIYFHVLKKKILFPRRMLHSSSSTIDYYGDKITFLSFIIKFTMNEVSTANVASKIKRKNKKRLKKVAFSKFSSLISIKVIGEVYRKRVSNYWKCDTYARTLQRRRSTPADTSEWWLLTFYRERGAGLGCERQNKRHAFLHMLCNPPPRCLGVWIFQGQIHLFLWVIYLWGSIENKSYASISCLPRYICSSVAQRSASRKRFYR